METLDLDVTSNHRRRRPIQIKKQTKMLSKLNQYYQSIMIGRFSIIWLFTRRILTYIFSFQNTRATVQRPEGSLIKNNSHDSKRKKEI